MSSLWLAAAWLTAAAHFALIAVLVAGGPISLRRPGFVRVHVVVAVAVGTVFVLGADCPLTTWQKYFLQRAGEVPYEGGFVEHYLVHPITGAGMPASMSLIVLAAWLAPTVVSYSILSQRRLGRHHRTSG